MINKKTTGERLAAQSDVRDSDWVSELRELKKNQGWLLRSASVALQVLAALEEKKMTQKDLAGLLDVTPQYISKLLGGNVNFTLETIDTLEEALGISIDISKKKNFESKHNTVIFSDCKRYTLYNVSQKTIEQQKRELISMVQHGISELVTFEESMVSNASNLS